MEQRTSFYSTGPFAPVREERTVGDLFVEGQIPPELNGRYVRNGPNPLHEVGPNHHWFLGEGMLHGVRLRDGRAEWYRNRAVRAGTVPKTLGERDPGGPKGMGGADAAPNTHVFRLGRRSFATVEGGPNPVEFDDELETIGRSNLGGFLKSGFTAHPKRDPATGEVHAITYNFGMLGRARYLRLDASGKRLNAVDIKLAGPTMVHDVAITHRHVIVFDLNCGFDFKLFRQNAFPLVWQPNRPGRVGVLPKTGTARDLVWYETEPCFAFHAMNAFENADGTIAVDVCRYDEGSFGGLGGPAGKTLPTLERWILDPRAGTARASVRRLGATRQDLPRISPLVEGGAYRYGYGLGQNGEEEIVSVKNDLLSGTEAVRGWNGGMPGELTFVPRPEAQDEDDGWLLGFVTYSDEDRSVLVILEAQDFSGEPAAVVHVPHRIPVGFHGDWLPDD
jgi:carotenoid cleavage dioxygenase